MAASLDDVFVRFQSRGDAASTLALCEALRRDPRADALEALGLHVQERMQSNVPVLLATARLFLETERLADAQALLVSAGKAAPRDAAVYRWLGEVLLRRGDAERAEKVLERAASFGALDATTAAWLDRARALRGTQAQKGTRAVAVEVARRYPVTAPDDDETNTHTFRKNDGQPAQVRPRGQIPITSQLSPRPAPVSQPTPFDAPTRQVATRSAVPPPLPSSAPAPAVAPPPLAATPPLAPPPLVPAPRAAPPPRATAPAATPAPRGAELATKPTASATDDTGDLLDTNQVLDALAAAGVYESDETLRAALSWDRSAQRLKVGKRLLVLLGTMGLVIGGAIGVHFYFQDVRHKRHLEAEALLDTVDANLTQANIDHFTDTERSLARAFELDSRSQRAALAWLRERAMRALLEPGAQEIAFADAQARAREVGVGDAEIAFSEVAQALFQGDLAAAASQVAKLDPIAKDDAHFQLLAGATFERAGDPRALERYTLASTLAPSWVLAELLTARAAIFNQAPGANEAVTAFNTKHKGQPSAVALTAMAWALDPERPVPAPSEVATAVKLRGGLPLPLLTVPFALRAMGAHEAGDRKVMSEEITQALGAVDSPAMATWLGDLAASAGDDKLAERAAVMALSFSSAYAPARTLVARALLLGGNPDSSQKATEGLEPADPLVASVRAAIGYEQLDTRKLAGALEKVGNDESGKRPRALLGLELGRDALLGNPDLPALAKQAGQHAFWADIIHIDALLDRGDLQRAQHIKEYWSKDADAVHHAARLSRLARYQDDLEQADRESLRAISAGIAPFSLFERTMVLLSQKRADDAAKLLSYGAERVGPIGAWLHAAVIAAGGKTQEARARLANVELPDESSPYLVRLAAVVASGAMRDQKRGTALIRPMLKAKLINPDVRAAAAALNMPKL